MVQDLLCCGVKIWTHCSWKWNHNHYQALRNKNIRAEKLMTEKERLKTRNFPTRRGWKYYNVLWSTLRGIEWSHPIYLKGLAKFRFCSNCLLTRTPRKQKLTLEKMSPLWETGKLWSSMRAPWMFLEKCFIVLLTFIETDRPKVQSVAFGLLRQAIFNLLEKEPTCL